MKFLSTILIALMATLAIGQEITMYETHTLTAKQGQEMQLEKAIAEHNRLYHADPESPYMNHMSTILNGPRSGDIFFAMGSCSFAELEGRPSSDAHNKDWATVLQHTDGGAINVEYWVEKEDLSYVPKTPSDDPHPYSVVRYYEVTDNSDFIEVQGQIKNALKKMGYPNQHIMYKNRFQNKDGRNWASVTWYKSMGGLDVNHFDLFKKTFKELYGDAGWDNFDQKYGETVASREDEMRVRRPDLQGDYKK